MTVLPALPRLASKARLKFDRHEGRHVLLYPEKGLILSESSVAILQLCTGEHRVADIVDALFKQHADARREQIESDVQDFLESLHVRGLLQDTP